MGWGKRTFFGGERKDEVFEREREREASDE
jgi:hypothetical protein